MSHLTDHEIERYIQNNEDASGDIGPLENHLAQCEVCHSRFLEAERTQLDLHNPGLRNIDASGDCPPEDDLQAFAAGVGSAAILEHVAECDHCAPLLREYLAVIDEKLEPNPDPRTNVSPAGLKKTTIDGSSISPKIPYGLKKIVKSYYHWPVFAKRSLAGIPALVACIFVAPPAWNAYNLNKTEKAITVASQEAPLKMRLSWGEHPRAALLKDPAKPPSAADNPSLGLASELVSNNQNVNDPRWVLLRARVKLILGEYEESAKLLSIATEMGLNDPDTEIDLAVASFQRDSQENPSETSPANNDPSSHSSGKGQPTTGDRVMNPVYLSESLESLTKVLKNPKLTPNQRATATFDLAMVYQRMQLWDQAVPIWEEYLELDPGGAWHDDARHNLEEARKKIPAPKPQGYRTPEFFLNHLSDPDVLASLEDYQEIALREWLPQIDKPNHDEFLAALRKLAEMMESRHGDPWMRDFLAARRPSEFRRWLP